MKTLKVTIAKITEVIENSTDKQFGIVWTRTKLVFIGETSAKSEGMTVLKKSLRKGALAAMSEDIKKELNKIGMDCDFIAGINGETDQFFVRLTVKELPEQPVSEDKSPAAPKQQKEKTPKADKKAGVLETICTLIKEAPQTQASILDKLIFLFPEREADAMKKTITAQLGGFKTQPTRMERERKVEFLIEVKDKIATYTFKGETK